MADNDGKGIKPPRTLFSLGRPGATSAKAASDEAAEAPDEAVEETVELGEQGEPTSAEAEATELAETDLAEVGDAADVEGAAEVDGADEEYVEEVVYEYVEVDADELGDDEYVEEVVYEYVEVDADELGDTADADDSIAQTHDEPVDEDDELVEEEGDEDDTAHGVIAAGAVGAAGAVMAADAAGAATGGAEVGEGAGPSDVLYHDPGAIDHTASSGAGMDIDPHVVGDASVAGEGFDDAAAYDGTEDPTGMQDATVPVAAATAAAMAPPMGTMPVGPPVDAPGESKGKGGLIAAGIAAVLVLVVGAIVLLSGGDSDDTEVATEPVSTTVALSDEEATEDDEEVEDDAEEEVEEEVEEVDETTTTTTEAPTTTTTAAPSTTTAAPVPTTQAPVVTQTVPGPAPTVITQAPPPPPPSPASFGHNLPGGQELRIPLNAVQQVGSVTNTGGQAGQLTLSTPNSPAGSSWLVNGAPSAGTVIQPGQSISLSVRMGSVDGRYTFSAFGPGMGNVEFYAKKA